MKTENIMENHSKLKILQRDKMHMKKTILTFFIFCFCITVYSQNIQFGCGFGFDMGVNFEETNKYKIAFPELGISPVMLVTTELHTKISLNKFNFYPTIDLTVSSGKLRLENLQGKSLADGGVVYLPYRTVNNGWSLYHYGSKYLYHLSDGYLKHTKIGSYLTYSIANNLEIGSGLFYVIRNTKIDSYEAFDKYKWYGSVGTTSDKYSWSETIVKDYEVFATDNIQTKNILLPLMIQYSIGNEKFTNSYSLVAFFGKDTYLSARMTIGFGL